jgi:hypothetical protein
MILSPREKFDHNFDSKLLHHEVRQTSRRLSIDLQRATTVPRLPTTVGWRMLTVATEAMIGIPVSPGSQG